MSITYNENGYPIYSGGEEFLYASDAEKIYEKKRYFGKFNLADQESNITITGNNYSDNLPFDLEFQSNNNAPVRADSTNGIIEILENGFYKIYGSLYFGMGTPTGLGIYCYNTTKDEITNEDYTYEAYSSRSYGSTGNTSSVGARTLANNILYLKKGDKLSFKARAVLSTYSTSVTTIHTNNQCTYLCIEKMQ